MAIIGRYILTPEIFDILDQKNYGTGGEIQITDAMQKLLKHQPIYGFAFQGTRYDCGDKAGFQMANLACALERPDLRAALLPFIQKLLERENPGSRARTRRGAEKKRAVPPQGIRR